MSERHARRTPADGPPKAVADSHRVRELAGLFLKLGTTAFGGPAAHIAMMEHEVVVRREWLTRQEFLDLLAATNLIPGPNSTEMAIHIGLRRAGWPGFVVAGTCFILPAAILTLGFAWCYTRFGSMPRAEGFLHGVQAAAVAIILHALRRFARDTVRNAFTAAVVLAAAAAHALGVHELTVLAAGGVAMSLARSGAARAATAAAALPGIPSLALAQAATSPASPFRLDALFLFFLKVGWILFGSGYVLLAFLRADLVERWSWMTEAQLLDAVAAGQVTPGPVLSTATFIGYVLGGLPGAALATLGIFLPAFVFVAICGPLVPRVRASRVASSFLDGVIATSLGLMAQTAWQLGAAAVSDAPSAAILAGSAAAVFLTRANPALVVVAGGTIGILCRGV